MIIHFPTKNKKKTKKIIPFFLIFFFLFRNVINNFLIKIILALTLLGCRNIFISPKKIIHFLSMNHLV